MFLNSVDVEWFWMKELGNYVLTIPTLASMHFYSEFGIWMFIWIKTEGYTLFEILRADNFRLHELVCISLNMNNNNRIKTEGYIQIHLVHFI